MGRCRHARRRPSPRGQGGARGGALGAGARRRSRRRWPRGDARGARRPRPGALVPRRRRGGDRRARARVRALRARGQLRPTPPAPRSGSRTSTISGPRRRPRAAGSSRAERALEGAGPARVTAGSPSSVRGTPTTVEECAEHARRAMTIARETDAADLEVFALSMLGRAEVSAGRRAGGDAAAGGGDGGRVGRSRARRPHARRGLLQPDHRRARARATGSARPSGASWSTSSRASHGVMPLFGACRTIHADVLLATGRWPEAERALESALATHARYVPEMGAPTVADDGRAARPPGPAARGRAAARRARGAPVVAARARPAADRGGPAERRRRAARARAAGGGGRRDAGDAAARPARRRAAGVRRRRRRRGGRRGGSPSSRAAQASGSSPRARTSPPRAWRLPRRAREDAAEPASRALAAFSRLAMPLDAGEARLELARALADTAPDLARDEARTAFGAFRELGASRAMDVAARGAEDLGAGTAGAPARYGELTAREQEVLGLLALGMSNARIAQHAVHQREDGRPSRQPDPLEARRAQPRRGRRACRTRAGLGTG